MSWQPELDELNRRKALAREMGGPEKVDKHRSHGKLPIRERIAALLDAGTFREVGTLAGKADTRTASSTASRRRNFRLWHRPHRRRKVVIGGDDFTVRGGAADACIARQADAMAEHMANELRSPWSAWSTAPAAAAA